MGNLKRRRAFEALSPEETQALAERRKAREGRVLKLARAQLHAASREKVEAKPDSARWYCLQVASGHDFTVEKLLSDCGVEVLAPREKVTLVRRGRKIASERAYFSGYLLTKIVPSPEAFEGLRRQKNVFGFVSGAHGYLVVNSEEVQKFQRLRPGAVSRMPTDKTICEGSQAVIAYGPFAELVCTVLAVKWSREGRVRVRIVYDGNPFEIADMPLAFLKKL
ncbi:transcription termination/antitermination NusG family protein [Rhizobium sp. RU36D]|uniref:transcription termination/antitermination protein NusG n=1 Tax=Rhizobium sp. RU36D TaxID=1907415 RepID=UPI0009D8CF5F|nr:transcription termination/antitermination NusG family protein [Rhizobium sp. RU36D]SMD18187.1 transcriptional antiterminator NusG [Rhizobium sp. RU36D]